MAVPTPFGGVRRSRTGLFLLKSKLGEGEKWNWGTRSANLWSSKIYISPWSWEGLAAGNSICAVLRPPKRGRNNCKRRTGSKNPVPSCAGNQSDCRLKCLPIHSLPSHSLRECRCMVLRLIPRSTGWIWSKRVSSLCKRGFGRIVFIIFFVCFGLYFYYFLFIYFIFLVGDNGGVTAIPPRLAGGWQPRRVLAFHILFTVIQLR